MYFSPLIFFGYLIIIVTNINLSLTNVFLVPEWHDESNDQIILRRSSDGGTG